MRDHPGSRPERHPLLLTILGRLGCEVERASGVVQIRAEKIQTEAPYEIVRKMRASVCVLGPLLGREKAAGFHFPEVA